jgi:HSP20 family protein
MSSRKGHRHAVELTLLQKEVEQIFARLGAIHRHDRIGAGEWSPPLDVFESKDHLTIVAEVPGLAPDSLSVVCRNRQIVLSGERRHDIPSDAVAGFLCLERPHGRFSRAIPLNQAVDVSRAVARLDQGLLTISIPRLKERRSREVVIPVRREGEND